MLSRFKSTCFIFPLSAYIGGMPSSMCMVRVCTFSSTSGDIVLRASSNTSPISKTSGMTSSLPASIFEISRTPLMRMRSCLPLVKISSRHCCCSSFMSPVMPSSMSSEKPMMEFNGVRSSWDMLAMNSDLCRLAFSSSWAFALISS